MMRRILTAIPAPALPVRTVSTIAARNREREKLAAILPQLDKHMLTKQGRRAQP